MIRNSCATGSTPSQILSKPPLNTSHTNPLRPFYLTAWGIDHVLIVRFEREEALVP
jgi:hypothetical protein